VLVTGSVASCGQSKAVVQPRAHQSNPAPAPSPPIPTQSQPSPPAHTNGNLVFTYYYYWYDQATNAHLGPTQPLPIHPVPSPETSYKSVAWHEQELQDMTYAGIDVVLPVYWGFGSQEQWSTDGLGPLVQAEDDLTAAGKSPPKIGLFFDTTIMAGYDLTTEAGIAFFYANVHDFFSRIPRSQWALVDGKPVVWMWTPQSGNVFGPSLFEQIYSRFTADFGIRPYVVREAGWYCAITTWVSTGPGTRDCSQPIQTDGMYSWGAAYDGYKDVGNVAEVGPGYDERLIPGRPGKYRPRDDGNWYQMNFNLAIASQKKLLAIETWNEFHEATAICETVEYGRTYLDLTRQLTAQYKSTA
jgi:hypothetical protein